jgi:aryl-alcohol dehydrogenase-like predicted oxidoreductase
LSKNNQTIDPQIHTTHYQGATVAIQPPKETLFLHTAEMGLGAWAWGDRMVWNYGHGYTDTDILEAFQISLAGGVNLVDTAEVYGNGRSEILLGKFLQETRQPVIVATKFLPFPWRQGRKSVLRALRASLKRLGLDKVDLYQIHWPTPITPTEVFAEGLALAVQNDLARAVGVSNYNKNQMQRVYTVLSKYNIPLASNQVEYHLLNRKIEKNGLLDRCKELGIRVIAYSPLAKGLLTGKYSPEIPPPPSRGNTSKEYLKHLQNLTELMKEIGAGHGGKKPGQVALNWTICKGTLPIPGAKTNAQASENLGALGWRLTSEEIKTLDTASAEFTE